MRRAPLAALFCSLLAPTARAAEVLEPARPGGFATLAFGILVLLLSAAILGGLVLLLARAAQIVVLGRSSAPPKGE